jgi:hypothetical protein
MAFPREDAPEREHLAECLLKFPNKRALRRNLLQLSQHKAEDGISTTTSTTNFFK